MDQVSTYLYIYTSIAQYLHLTLSRQHHAFVEISDILTPKGSELFHKCNFNLLLINPNQLISAKEPD